MTQYAPGQHPHSRANLKRTPKPKIHRRPRNNTPEFAAMMREKKRLKQLERERLAAMTPVVVEVVENVTQDFSGDVPTKVQTQTAPAAPAPKPETPPPGPAWTEIGRPRDPFARRVTWELAHDSRTVGDRMADLAQRDYELLMSGQPLPVDPPSTFPRVRRSRLSLDQLGV